MTTFPWGGAEVGVSWFFHTVGSGIFLDCHNLPTSGSIVAYESRLDFIQQHGGGAWVGDGAPSLTQYMNEQNIAMLVFTQADYADVEGYAPGTTNPRTEIIVRTKEATLDEFSLPSLSCLTDPEMGFVYSTGLTPPGSPCLASARRAIG